MNETGLYSFESLCYASAAFVFNLPDSHASLDKDGGKANES